MLAMAIAAFAPTALTQQSEVAKIRALSDQWQQDIAAKNVNRIVGLHAPDAVIMFSHAPLVTGTTAIRGVYAEMVDIPGLVLHWTPTKIDVAGPVATEYGTYSESYNTPQGKESDAGNYVVIWHKIKGKWQVAVDAPNTTTPLPTPPVDSSAMEMRAGSTLTWNDLTGPGIPPGAKIAVLHGNPGGAGGFVLRLQFPDGYQIPAHWHPTPENVTVVSGNLQLGMGNTFNATALQSYAPGDYAYLPPRQSHFAQARGVTVVQVHGRGPFQINLGAPK
jgi:ketosteroid isomerase-like protein/quercetin dioxygenase-like cupin family protein